MKRVLILVLNEHSKSKVLKFCTINSYPHTSINFVQLKFQLKLIFCNNTINAKGYHSFILKQPCTETRVGTNMIAEH